MIKIIGYILLAISCLLFVLIIAVPWLNYTKATLAVITTVLIITGELLFYGSILIIGKDFILRLGSKLKFWKTKTIGNINQRDVEPI
jgi:uncharacterized membrane protein YbhN (UPF0104 family)